MPLTIIFHGTSDTHYPDDQSYLKINALEPIGEGAHTLSFFADCIEIQPLQLEEPLFSIARTLNPDPYLLIVRNELVVIQGADNTGTEVHNLIMTGLMAAINALLRGERHIHFVGFSRGSVEAIHMTHELQRIKHYLNDTTQDQSPSAIVNFICEGCFNPSNLLLGKWRTTRLNTYYKDALNQVMKNFDHLNHLRTGLSDRNLQCNGMLLDPVPGMCEGSALTYVPWTALAQHTEIAPLVDELTIAYMSDELSVGFRAVWVEAAADARTKINRFHLPGYHSTANGNPVNHDPATALKPGQNFPFMHLRTAQRLYFYKLLQFAAKHNIPLKAPALLAGRYLQPVFAHFIEHRNEPAMQNAYLRNLYQDIAAHRSDYRKTRDTFYIPRLLGVGGKEQAADHQRIIMTKSGARSLADCFGFALEDSQMYVNFDHFFLDFVETLFPEINRSPAGSPLHQELTYSGILQTVKTKYTSPSVNMDYELLIAKIRALLAECQIHQLDSRLNQVLLEDQLDRDGILMKLIELIPTQLAAGYYNANLTAGERAQFEAVMREIEDFRLEPIQEGSLPLHQGLLSKKQQYIELFQTHMRTAMNHHTQRTLEQLLDNATAFQYQAFSWQPSSAEPAFAILTYLEEADQYFHALHVLQDKLNFSLPYIAIEEQSRIQYRIAQAVAHFPVSCMQIAHQYVDGYSADILAFQVMRSVQEKIEMEDELVAEKQSARKLLHQIEIQQKKIQKLIAEKASLHTKLRNAAVIYSQIVAEKKQLTAQLTAGQQTSQDDRKNIVNLEQQLATQAQSFQILQTRLQNIEHILHISQQAHCCSSFILQLLSSLSSILGVMIATLSGISLVFGTGIGAIPALGIGIGASLAVTGLYGFRLGSHRQYEEQLNERVFRT